MDKFKRAFVELVRNQVLEETQAVRKQRDILKAENDRLREALEEIRKDALFFDDCGCAKYFAGMVDNALGVSQ